jgi:hypothetical protein
MFYLLLLLLPTLLLSCPPSQFKCDESCYDTQLTFTSSNPNSLVYTFNILNYKPLCSNSRNIHFMISYISTNIISTCTASPSTQLSKQIPPLEFKIQHAKIFTPVYVTYQIQRSYDVTYQQDYAFEACILKIINEASLIYHLQTDYYYLDTPIIITIIIISIIIIAYIEFRFITYLFKRCSPPEPYELRQIPESTLIPKCCYICIRTRTYKIYPINSRTSQDHNQP